MPVHYFEVFEFKSRFEFNCLSVLKIEILFLLALFALTLFWPVLVWAQC
jgi:hypothetical protein